MAEYVFWFAALMVFYTYFGYPFLLFICFGAAQIVRDWHYLTRYQERRRCALADEDLPAVTMMFAAYNEEKHLPQKLRNLSLIDYPREKLQVVIVSDGSTDATNALLQQVSDSCIEVMICPERGGKASALQLALSRARHDILVLSDCSTIFQPDALRKLVRHFVDPRVGVVCGALRFEGGPESRETEGVYWKYETALRMMEARLGSTLTPSGAIYAVRRRAYCPLSPLALVDDIITSMNARRQGYRVLYDPEALAVDYPASSVAGEFKRRVRIAIGSSRALPSLLSVRLKGFALFAFLSHKLFRWVVPLLLIMMLVSNLALLTSPLYRMSLLLQLAIYVWALVGFVFRHRLRRVRFALLGYFLLAMNLAFLVGMVRSLNGRKEAAWQRVE